MAHNLKLLFLKDDDGAVGFFPKISLDIIHFPATVRALANTC